MERRGSRWLAVLLVALTTGAGSGGATSESDQLSVVRSEIRALEQRLAGLDAAAMTARQQQEALRAELELAQARVRENELLLTRSRDEILRLRLGLEQLTADL